MQQQTSTVDRLIARLARVAHGVVTRKELLAVGVTPEQIRQRVDRGSLLPVFPGVYRVGHAAPSLQAHYTAAVKACGEGARLSGRAAAHLWQLLRGDPPPPEVTTRYQKRIKGIQSKRSHIPDDEAAVHRRIPVTTVARTLVDLAAVLSEDALARAFHEASVGYGTKPEEVERLLERRPNTSGAAALRRVVRGDTDATLSRMEARFPKLLKEHGLPLPVMNRRAGARFVDCRWPEHKLTVELDSYRFHNSRHAWTQDRRREREAYARGDQFRRYTWADVFEDATAMLRELRELLT